MADIGDIFSVKIVSEFEGVSMANETYWELDDKGDDPTLGTFVFDFLGEFHNAVKTNNSSLWKVVCGIYNNIADPEGTVVIFRTLAGDSLNTGHPQFQTAKLQRYAQSTSGSEIKHGSFSLSGVEEVQSVRGRWSDLSIFDALRDFLRVTSIISTGWTIQPMMRWNTIAPTTPPIYQYVPIRHAFISPQVNVLRSRKTKLCATS